MPRVLRSVVQRGGRIPGILHAQRCSVVSRRNRTVQKTHEPHVYVMMERNSSSAVTSPPCQALRLSLFRDSQKRGAGSSCHTVCGMLWRYSNNVAGTLFNWIMKKVRASNNVRNSVLKIARSEQQIREQL
ncbi:hypothetical protein NDU88_002986 [Pleurodeles waltl]|uniref:Uncharacterized protein n=1 Tax=Pleurodeles waltl TaxID=8319 RepID=A0AAV7W403_PLEWA|nr:hypothetical protein NDU88_002986 [Pleurodeles waltl]